MILNDEELAGIAELARKHRLWVIADQVYAGLAPGGTVPTLTSMLPDQLVTVGSLSKSLSMPGWRAGWMVAPAEFARHAEHVVMCMLFGLPGFIQDAGVRALQIAAQAEANVRDYCSRRRDLMSDGLAGIAGIQCLLPQAGMFMLVDVAGTGLNGRQFMRELYAQEKVSVLDGGTFGSDTAGVVRICFATDEKNIVEACGRIRRFISSRSAVS